jgi:hypothetical protein
MNISNAEIDKSSVGQFKSVSVAFMAGLDKDTHKIGESKLMHSETAPSINGIRILSGMK